MLIFALYLIGCFLAGLSIARRNDKRIVWTLLLICVGIAAVYYWVDAARALRASVPPGRTVRLEDIPQYAAPQSVLLPRPAVAIAWCAFFVSLLITAWRPSWGLCLLLFWTLAADPVLAPWYPMTKDFSSGESIFYVADWVIVNPLECLLLVALGAWAIDAIRTRRTGVPLSALLLVGAAFAASLAAGFVRGAISGFNLNVALWELRGPSYAIAVLPLTSRYIRTKADAASVIWAAMLAIAVESIWITAYLLFRDQTSEFRAFADHATSVHANTAIVLLAAAWLYRSSPAMRFGLPWIMPPLVISYLQNQRRAALFGLAVALSLLVVVGRRINPRLIRRAAPLGAAAAAVWLVLAWNDPGPLGLPARTVKSILNSSERSLDDRESDYYRVLEDADIIATVRTSPWTGVGFGRPFDVPVPLPTIPFIWWQYITHNAVLWIWMKAGLGGFVALLLWWGMAIFTGAHTSLRAGDSDLGAIVVTATLFVIMFAIYAFVDMAWDSRSTVYLGAMMGLIVSIDRLATDSRKDSTAA